MSKIEKHKFPYGKHASWTSKDGRVSFIREMSDSHLENTIRFLERRKRYDLYTRVALNNETLDVLDRTEMELVGEHHTGTAKRYLNMKYELEFRQRQQCAAASQSPPSERST